ncbi:MAG: prolipoprotein diacylglyceryl transferase [Cyclobacteriaceae bacterium]|nr:prolipoprotein diacylglyceryl transferase [Cyclobacteriaceae bacterium HetDA_MAG_MS6]
MHPELFSIGSLTIHSYGFMIMLGAIAGYAYMSLNAKKELGIALDKIQSLAIYIIVAAFVGGKLLFYLEKPSYYFNPPSNMLVNFRTGFVFYGSLLFAIPVAVWYFRKEKWPIWPVLDRLAIAGTIIHAFGRMGCFLAGCCYGLPTDKPWGVAFTEESSQAQPLHEHLHPTQLYSAGMICSIMVVLLMFKRHKRFEGQLIFVYLILYAAGRGIIEIFRGDLRRGFIIEGVLSHSQLISLVLITITLSAYFYFRKKPPKG